MLSLQTNVPLQESLQICTNILYRGHLGPPAIHKAVFLEFVHLATEQVEFIFDANMCKSMRFRQVRFQPTFLLVIMRASFLKKKSCKLCVYWRYLDDIFSIFKSINDARDFYILLNSLHPSLQFTMEVVVPCRSWMFLLNVMMNCSSAVFIANIHSLVYIKIRIPLFLIPVRSTQFLPQTIVR